MGEFIKIGTTDHAEALRLGAETFAIFEGKRGRYFNSLDRHQRGKLGEIAVERWLGSKGLGVDPVFRDLARMREADIVAIGSHTLRLEVKTWAAHNWKSLGRCVTPEQRESIEARADAVIWCVSPSSLLNPGIEVELFGWNTLAEIEAAPRRMTGPPGAQVDNYQVDSDKVRPLPSLLAALTVAQ